MQRYRALIFLHGQNHTANRIASRVKFYFRHSLKAERNYHRPISDRNPESPMLSRGILRAL